MEIEGGTTCSCSARILGSGFTQDCYFGFGHVGVVCMNVRKHSRATSCARMLVGGDCNLVLATSRNPLVWGMGGNVCHETNFGCECEVAAPATR